MIDQCPGTGEQSYELHPAVTTDPGACVPYPTCGRLCKPHDRKETSWQHLNFSQHASIATARVPRTDHGVLRIVVSWASPDTGFILLFEQAALLLMRVMPVSTTARIIGVTGQRLRRALLFG